MEKRVVASKRKGILRACVLAAFLLPAHRSPASEVAVAAAANLAYVLKPLDTAFEQAAPGVNVRTEIGSSGSLVAQIENGAPYDVFLSADTDYPARLVADGAAQKESLVLFAYGKLVLWTTRKDLVLDSVGSVVRNAAVRKLAVANPKTAPYGRAALETLEALHADRDVEPKLVIGDSITQTAQFVSSGNADAGFVALSLVMAPNLPDKGRWLPVPENLYKPLAQAAVLTRHGSSNAGAAAFLRFLTSPQAKAVFVRFGYNTP